MRYVFSTLGFLIAEYQEARCCYNLLCHDVKGAIGLTGCTPDALVHEDECKGGLAVTFLLHPYVQEQINTLVKSLHDNGRLGSMTKWLLKKQLQHVGLVPELNGRTCVTAPLQTSWPLCKRLAFL